MSGPPGPGTNGRARLEAWWAEGALVRPDPAAATSVDLARALAAAVGAPGPALTPAAAAIADALDAPEHLVLVLIDGLGLELVRRLPPDRWLPRARNLPLRAVFPSATASALTSLATGLSPAEHGVPGWWTYLPERALTVTTLPCVERFSGQPFDALGLTLGDVYPAGALLAGYPRDAAAWQPAAIAGSPYSRWALGERTSRGYDAFEAAVDAVVERVDTAAGPTYTYLYASALDTLQHDLGPDDPAVLALALEFDRALARLAAGLAGRARLVVTADHGQVTIPEAGKTLLAPGDPLLDLLLVPPTGEPRAPLLHARPGRRDDLARAFEARLGDRWALVPVDDAEALGLFGPARLAPRTRARVGDFVALARGREVICYAPPAGHNGTAKLRGYHGGLLAAEVEIPLVVA